MGAALEHIRRMNENWAAENRAKVDIEERRLLRESMRQRTGPTISHVSCRRKRNKTKKPRRAPLRGREAVENYLAARIDPDIPYVFYQGYMVVYGRDLLRFLRSEGIVDRILAARGRAAYIDRQLPRWIVPLNRISTHELVSLTGCLLLPWHLKDSFAGLNELRHRLSDAAIAWPQGTVQIAISVVETDDPRLKELLGGLLNQKVPSTQISGAVLRQAAMNNLNDLARECSEAAKGCLVVYGEKKKEDGHDKLTNASLAYA